MHTRAIRGAISVNENTQTALKEAVKELIEEMVRANSIEVENISHVIFTLTKDLDAGFPAKYARVNLKWKDVPMMCVNEMAVPTGLAKCLRVLIVVNCSENFEPEFVYLDGAKDLRK